MMSSKQCLKYNSSTTLHQVALSRRQKTEVIEEFIEAVGSKILTAFFFLPALGIKTSKATIRLAVRQFTIPYELPKLTLPRLAWSGRVSAINRKGSTGNSTA